MAGCSTGSLSCLGPYSLQAIWTQCLNWQSKVPVERPGQLYVRSILSSGSISGENLRPLNVKYVMLVKEVEVLRSR